MAILRAGPWGRINDPRQNVWTDFEQEPTAFPVNCAKNDWTNQVWGAVYEKNAFFPDEEFAEYGLAGLGENVTVVSPFYPAIVFTFCYQATQPFDVNFNWSFTDSNLLFPTLSWDYQTMEGNSDGFFITPQDSGTEVIPLPASTFGFVNAIVDAVVFQDEATLTSSLT